MTNNMLLNQILSTLKEEKKYHALRDVLAAVKPADLAELLEQVPENQIPILFRLLGREQAAEVFVELDSHGQERLIRGLSDKELKAVVDELAADDAADLVEEMPAPVVTRILRQADPEIRRTINELLRYPEDSAGSIMTVEYMALGPEMTAAEAIDAIRATGVGKETVDPCYVVDGKGRLLGSVAVRELIVSPADRPVAAMMEADGVTVLPQTDQEAVAQMFGKYDLLSLPVTDGDRRLMGIITVDDVLDVLQAEATEDMEKMAAITPSEQPYLHTSVWTLWKNRIPWLLLLMVSATFTGMIITRFESALAACVVLTAYIPMLMDTGGNCGSQASVTVIRALSLGQVQFRDTLRVAWKEMRVALLCGLTLAVVNMGKLLLLERVEIPVALAVSLTLVVTVFAAKLVGCTLPIAAKRLGFDPAVMASPFITTIVDALSLLIYFRFAALLLQL
ncbi:magnesium transporter [uncultured Dysosmobacter sp.]|uniref:magnesium transporter n=1 Tax=uncultured Dysosmobacter sp. TaxID=2591384 RepID=UPI00262C330C|nr:magnesium transporter [uncultured Dysosmobacter sp.]